MSDALLNAGRQTLMLELREASRLPERLGDDFVRAANTIIHCEGKVIVSGIGKSGHIGKNRRDPRQHRHSGVLRASSGSTARRLRHD